MRLRFFITFALFLIGMNWGAEVVAQGTMMRVRDEVDFAVIGSVSSTCSTCRVVSKKPYESDAKGIIHLSFVPDSTDIFHFSHPGYKAKNLSYGQIKGQGGEVFLEALTYTAPTVSIVSKFEEDQDNVAQRVESITTRDIEFQNPQSSADLLTQNGGVFVQKSQMGGGSPNLRGFEANKVLIVVDGVRMNNAIYRGGHLQNVVTIDPNLIERTEVMFGPGSVIYGSDALGGVMHFYSKRPILSTDDKPNIKGNAFYRYASANNELTGHVDLNVGFRKWGFISSVSASSFGDLRAGHIRPKDYPNFGRRDVFAEVNDNGSDVMVKNDDVNVQKSSGYNQIDLMQKFIYVQNWRVTHVLNVQYSTSSDVPRYDRLSQFTGTQLTYADWHYGPQKRFFTSYKGTMYGDSTFFDRMEWTAGYQNIEESRINRRFGSTSERNRIENVQVLSANVDAAKKIGSRHNLVYGVEAAHNIVGSEAFTRSTLLNVADAPLDTRYPDGGSVMRFLSAYASHHWDLNEVFSLTDGLRFSDVYLNSQFADKSFFPFLPDEITQHHQALSGNLGVVAKPGTDWKISLLGSTGFRAPNVDDLGKVFDSSPGNVIVPNANIKPEYTYNGELSVSKLIDSIFKIEATGFYTRYDNALQVREFQVDGQDSILYDGVLSNVQANVNAKDAYLFGVNLNLWLGLGDRFVITNTTSLTKGRDITSDVPLDHIPPLFGKASFQYRQKRFRGEVYVMYNGWKRIEEYSPSGEDNQVFATADGTYAWWTLNLKGALAVTENVRLQFGCENILDMHYRNFASGISAPGRNVILAFRVGF